MAEKDEKDTQEPEVAADEATEPEAAADEATEPEAAVAPAEAEPEAEAPVDEPAAEAEPEAEAPAEEPVAEAEVEEPAAEEAAAEEPAADAAATEEPEAATEEPEAAAEEPASAAADEGEAAAAPVAPKKKKRLPRALRRQRPKRQRGGTGERAPIVRLPKPEAERGRRQERQGTVVSDAMDKTIVVEVGVVKAHRKYKKVIRRTVKFHAHDEANSAKVGDVVRIVETRPLSATKRWRLVEIVEEAK